MSLKAIFKHVNDYLEKLNELEISYEYSYSNGLGPDGPVGFKELTNYIKNNLDGFRHKDWAFELLDLKKLVFGKRFENRLFASYRRGFNDLGFHVELLTINDSRSYWWNNREGVELLLATNTEQGESYLLLALPPGTTDAEKYFIDY